MLGFFFKAMKVYLFMIKKLVNQEHCWFPFVFRIHPKHHLVLTNNGLSLISTSDSAGFPHSQTWLTFPTCQVTELAGPLPLHTSRPHSSTSSPWPLPSTLPRCSQGSLQDWQALRAFWSQVDLIQGIRCWARGMWIGDDTGTTGFKNSLLRLSSRHHHNHYCVSLPTKLKTQCWKAGQVTKTGQHVSLTLLTSSQ